MIILFEDAHIIVCEKPVGTASQNDRGFEADMVSLLMQHFHENGEKPYVGVIHRLDKVVGGVMVYAKTKQAAARLSTEMQKREIKKYYYAVICKKPDEETARLADYLVRDGRTNTSRVAAKGEKDAKLAVLTYKVIETAGDLALLEIALDTGRHHQIRAQFASRGMALAGDRRYGTEVEKNASGTLALYAHKLEFVHPVTGKRMSFEKNPEGEIWNNFHLERSY